MIVLSFREISREDKAILRAQYRLENRDDGQQLIRGVIRA
jgi:hypothetical protein